MDLVTSTADLAHVYHLSHSLQNHQFVSKSRNCFVCHSRLRPLALTRVNGLLTITCPQSANLVRSWGCLLSRCLQITAEQIVREAKERQEDEMGGPRLGRVGANPSGSIHKDQADNNVKNPKPLVQILTLTLSDEDVMKNGATSMENSYYYQGQDTPQTYGFLLVACTPDRDLPSDRH